MSKVLQLITEEDFDPTEARINYLLESFAHQWEENPCDEYLELWSAIFEVSNIYNAIYYPSEKPEVRIKKYLRLMED